MKLRCADRVLALDQVAIMGVLNVTPDSFADGGLWTDPSVAIQHAKDMVAHGASIVDVGGESTRPGAEPVSEADELHRILPVVEALATEVDVPISIDTRKASVARRALNAGASIVNDTGGEATDRAMDQVTAETGAGILIMHSRGTPSTMRDLTEYGDVVTDVSEFLSRRAEEVQRLGVAPDAIALDPGFGFAKTPVQNLELLHDLDRIVALGYPIIAGTSRKSFIGATLDLATEDRIEGTVATVAWAVFKGARIVRVHDVQPVARTVRMVEAIMSKGVSLQVRP